jgi:hypothetical protein
MDSAMVHCPHNLKPSKFSKRHLGQTSANGFVIAHRTSGSLIPDARDPSPKEVGACRHRGASGREAAI